VEKLRRTVGLYLDPPDRHSFSASNEKSQVQALERTQPMLPIGFGYIEGVTHDDEPHGTTTLCGAQSARRLGPGAVQAASSGRLNARPR